MQIVLRVTLKIVTCWGLENKNLKLNLFCATEK